MQGCGPSPCQAEVALLLAMSPCQCSTTAEAGLWSAELPFGCKTSDREPHHKVYNQGHIVNCWRNTSSGETHNFILGGLQVTPEQSLALVEYIAHLSVEDWDGIARDLRKLGFVPAGTFL